MADYADSVLLVLRDIAKTEPKLEFRVVAKEAANSLDVAITRFAQRPSREHLQIVNGLWAIGQRIIDVWTAPEPTPPRAGAGEVYCYDEDGVGLGVPVCNEKRRAA